MRSFPKLIIFDELARAELQAWRSRRGACRARLAPAVAAVAMAAALGCAAETPEPSADTRPNLVLFLADDMGLGDASAYADLGNNPDSQQIATPNLERLASMGTRFTDVHSSAASCKPSRYALLSGRYSFREPRAAYRMSLEKQIGPNAVALLEGRSTLPQTLRDAGYRTYGYGKWHLGVKADPETGRITLGPRQLGFDHYTGSPMNPNKWNRLMRDDELVSFNRSWGLVPQNGPGVRPWKNKKGSKYASFRHVQGAVFSAARSQLADHLAAHGQKPFFLYYASHANHSPFITADRIADRPIDGHTRAGDILRIRTRVAEGEVVPDDPGYPKLKAKHWEEYLRQDASGAQRDNPAAARARMVNENDILLGAFLDTLESTDDPRRPGHKLLENTLIIFTSDNGADSTGGTVAVGALKQKSDGRVVPVRGKKDTQFEGGTRVPFVAAWAGQIAAGATSDALFGLHDLYATYADLVGAQLQEPGPDAEAPDSLSVSLALRGSEEAADGKRELILVAHRWLTLRRGDLRLTAEDQNFDKRKDSPDPEALKIELVAFRLVDLSRDLAEQTDLLKDPAYREVAADMTRTLQWSVDMGYTRPTRKTQP